MDKILPGESAIWFYIYQASISPVFTRKGAKITQICRLSQPFKKLKVVIFTYL